MVTVLVDLCQSDLTATEVSDLLNSTPGYGEEFMIATETLPDFWTNDEQRQAALTQLKTEILAGKNDEGQQILPLTFGFDVMGFSKEKFTLEAELPMTSDEMLESSDPMVRYTGRFRTGVRSVFGQINAAVFRTPVEQEFDRLTREVNTVEEEKIENIVHEHYVKMQMMFAES